MFSFSRVLILNRQSLLDCFFPWWLLFGVCLARKALEAGRTDIPGVGRKMRLCAVGVHGRRGVSSCVLHKHCTEAAGLFVVLIWTVFRRNFSSVPISVYALLFDGLTSEKYFFCCFSILDCRI